MFFVFPLFLQAQKIHFVKEELTFETDSEYFGVAGYYYFSNAGSKTADQQIFYPVYKDSLYRTFELLRIFNCNTGEEQNGVIITDNGAIFKISVNPGDSLCLHISYRQKIAGNKVCYILQSTQKWKKPLEKAIYTYISDKAVSESAFSYKPHKHSVIDGKNIYSWYFTSFMPERDFDIMIR
jgi:hypothetical protein